MILSRISGRFVVRELLCKDKGIEAPEDIISRVSASVWREFEGPEAPDVVMVSRRELAEAMREFGASVVDECARLVYSMVPVRPLHARRILTGIVHEIYEIKIPRPVAEASPQERVVSGR